jgi:hypothetical protein
MIPVKEWKWFGNAGHFICADDCRFHLCTLIGNILVSTVGQYFPGETVREIIAKHRGVKLEGRGDYRQADYMEKIGYETIGHKRKYETMSFKIKRKRCECGCGLPIIKPTTIDYAPYNDAKAATKGHHEICMKVAKSQKKRKKEARR